MSRMTPFSAVNTLLVFALFFSAGRTPQAESRHGYIPEPNQTTQAASEKTENSISITIDIANHYFKNTAEGTRVIIPGFGRLSSPGEPYLPARIFSIAIPPGAKFTGLSYEAGKTETVPGSYYIPPVRPARSMEGNPGHHEPDLSTNRPTTENISNQEAGPGGTEDQFARTYSSIYGSSGFYPVEIARFIRTSGYREYNLVDVRITPFQFAPASGSLRFHSQIRIHIYYEPVENSVTPKTANETEAPLPITSPDDPSGANQSLVPRQRKLEETARAIITNYDQAKTWQERTSIPNPHWIDAGASLIPEGINSAIPLNPGYPLIGAPADPPPFDFVIITLDNLIEQVEPLAEWERFKGRSVKIVTVSWIDSQYEGHDLAAKIRRFLREKYPDNQWGITDVLLVGHRDNLPMRVTHPQGANSLPETDFYYAELSLPDSESWDRDGDFRYGEAEDTIDYFGEVNVGRIPWSDPQSVGSICAKSVAYEQNNDPSFKNSILLLAAFVDEATDGAAFMEYTVDSEVHPWMAQWSKTRLYEADSQYDMDGVLNNDNVVSTWSGGRFAVVSWHAHGSPTAGYVGGSPFISTSDCARLNDDFPAIISAASCSNSDTDFLNIGQAMLLRGAVGFLGANKSAYYGSEWRTPSDGSDQAHKYFFLSRITSGQDTQGQALQYAIHEMYARGLWDYLDHETYMHSSLFGNPDLGINSYSSSAPPERPGTAAGPNHGMVNSNLYFAASALDPDSDQVYLCWSWGDGKVDWTGPHPSGGSTEAGHAWNSPGTFHVKVMARDIHGAESDWSEPVSITIEMRKQTKRRR